ncbi:UNVERIFIED_CONTAM: Retrovirus-related Pol polyprotein from transposon opus [Sesamum indicum]
MVKFLVVDMPFAYNVILGRPGLNSFRAIVSTYHLKMKFPTQSGIGEVVCDQIEAKRCYNLSLGKSENKEKRKLHGVKKEEWHALKAGRLEPVGHKEVELIQGDPSKTSKIGPSLGQFEGVMVAFLRSNVDMFAWDPSDFQGINPEVIVHRLNVDPSMRPVQQKKRTFGGEKNAIIEGEVSKLLRAGYVSEVQYTDWLANVVLVPKSGGKWRMCTDFTDLNKACPKDPYPLPRIDILVDSTAGYKIFSMMDAYQGYHQIYMATEDRIKTSFVTDRGIFCYNVMPFGLKNAGATYQMLVNKMFACQIGKIMEVYVDDMLVKSHKPDEHLEHLKIAFAIMREHGMKLNPNKCTFGVAGGKFLGYMVNERGIEANPEKIEAILNLKSPTSIKEVQKLTEIGEESQRIESFDLGKNKEQRAFDLDIVEEKRDAARVKMLHHKSLMLRGHDKNVKLRSLQVGDLVLRKVEVSKHVGKLDPNWEGPFKVIEIVGKGTYKLQDAQGKELPRPWNIQNLKRFYV